MVAYRTRRNCTWYRLVVVGSSIRQKGSLNQLAIDSTILIAVKMSNVIISCQNITIINDEYAYKRFDCDECEPSY